MAIKAIWGFDHLPVGTASGAIGNGYGLQYGNFPFTIANISGALFLSIAANGFITGGGAPSSALSCMNVTSNSVQDKTQRASWMGWRMRKMNTAIDTLGGYCPMICFGLNFLPYNTPGLATKAVGQDAFVEFCFDRVNNVVTAWVDGTLISTTPITSANLLSNYVISINKTASWDLRDFYFLDDTQDNTQCTRLGAVRLAPIGLTNVNQADWTTSDSSVAANWLASPLTSTTLTLPTVTNAIDQASMTMQLTVTQATYEKMLGVQMSVAGQRTTLNGQSGFTPSFTYNSVKDTDTKLTFTTTSVFEYTKRFLLREKGPDGNPWTPASFGATVLTLNPADGS